MCRARWCRSERDRQGTHNPPVAGSIPAGPTIEVLVRSIETASTRRAAFAPPFVGWVETLRAHPGVGDLLGMTIGAVTLAIAAAMAWRRAWTTPAQQAAIVSSAFIVGCGRAVWQYPTEAVRVMAPAQVLLFVAIVSTRRGDIRDGLGAEVSDCPMATRSNDESDLLLHS